MRSPASHTQEPSSAGARCGGLHLGHRAWAWAILMATCTQNSGRDGELDVLHTNKARYVVLGLVRCGGLAKAKERKLKGPQDKCGAMCVSNDEMGSDTSDRTQAL